MEEEGPESQEETVSRTEVGGSSAGPLQGQELMFEEQVLGEDGPNAAGFEELGRPKEQVQDQCNYIFHDPAAWHRSKWGQGSLRVLGLRIRHVQEEKP